MHVCVHARCCDLLEYLVISHHEHCCFSSVTLQCKPVYVISNYPFFTLMSTIILRHVTSFSILTSLPLPSLSTLLRLYDTSEYSSILAGIVRAELSRGRVRAVERRVEEASEMWWREVRHVQLMQSDCATKFTVVELVLV